MDFQNTPTDNLYKFISIAGLAIFILSIVGPYSHYREVKRLSIEQEGEKAVADTELTYIESDVAQLKRRFNMPEEEIKVLDENFASDCDRPKDSEGKPKLSCDEAKLLKDKVKEIRIKTERIKNRDILLRGLNNEVTELFILSLIGVIGGNVLVVIGFRLWYFRLQKPLDEIIKREAKKGK